MTSAWPRPGFHSSRLIRTLADWGVAAAAGCAGEGGAGPSFAERLSRWLDYLDAISLAAALAVPATPAAAAAGGPAIDDDFARVRAALADAIATALGGDAPARARPQPVPVGGDASADFAPYRRLHHARQREMDALIGPLRSRVRAALAARSAALRRLAALDAALEQALAARERQLLAALPVLLEKRFEQLQAHAMAGAEPHADWQTTFRRDLRNVLLAELEVRLAPVAGLIETHRHEATK